MPLHASPHAAPRTSPNASPHTLRYQREAGKCWSRAELPCYAGDAGSDRSDLSERLRMKMRQYHTYRRECLLKEPKATLQATLLSNKPTLCRYLVYYHTRDGQGNRLVSLMSAFAYALLTDRILLLASGSGLAEEFCEPFEHGAAVEASRGVGENAGEDASWVLFDGPDRDKYVWMLRFKVAREWRSVREEEESGSMVPPVYVCPCTMLCHAMPCHAMPCRAMPYSAMLYRAMPHSVTSACATQPSVPAFQHSLSDMSLLPSFPSLIPTPLPLTCLPLPPFSSPVSFPLPHSPSPLPFLVPFLAPLPCSLRVDITHFTKPSGHLFFCESEQQWLSRTPTLLIYSNQYHLPALYLLPSFRRRLLLLFPSHHPFRSLSRLLLFPRNRIWAQLTHRFHSLIAPASARIGLQGRFQKQALERGIPWETKAMGRCLLDALNSSSVHQAREVQVSNQGSDSGDGSSGSGGDGCNAVGNDPPSAVTEVMVASLSPVLAHNLSVMVAENVPRAQVTMGSDTPCAATAELDLPPKNGVKTPADSHIHIARLTVDELENNTDTSLVDRAILDIYTLALFSDALVISRNSTFGYVSASLFGVPYVSFVGPTCMRAVTEPCLHFPPSNDRCPDGVPQQLQLLLAVAPDVPLTPCVDRPTGIAVRPLEM
ncbi:unnamed protein product [Closterium sp. NIES-53]